MAIATGTAILAASVVGGGAAIYGASKQAGAAKDAANIGAQAAQQQLAQQERAYQNADRILTPYSQEGAAARRMYNALLGVPTAAAAPAQLQTGLLGSSRTGSQELDTYIANNPALQEYWSGWETGAGSGKHRAMFGDFNGYALSEYRKAVGRDPTQGGYADTPGAGGSLPMNGDQIAADREQAMSAFRASPYSTIARDSAQRGTNALFSTAAAMGRGVNSGKTMRAAADWNNTAQNNALVSFMGSLGGVADTGYNADSGRASGGQTFANNASNALAAQANAQAQGRIGAANAWGQGLSNAAGFIGWGAGQYGGGQSGGGKNALFYSAPTQPNLGASSVAAYGNLPAMNGGPTAYRF